MTLNKLTSEEKQRLFILIEGQKLSISMLSGFKKLNPEQQKEVEYWNNLIKKINNL